jgi:carbonic anhydrase/acetyltransferase-like protein (isoleucine patch superfamily)
MTNNSVLINSNHQEISLYPYQNKFPKIHDSVFLAPGVKIIGDVVIGANSSVWYNSVVRGDVNYIRIGDWTNIQDLSMLHVTNGKYPLIIGNKVTVGHGVTLHGAIIEDLSFVGIGSLILDGAIVESNSMVAAGSLVKQGFKVPSGKLVAGVPAKIIRELKDEEIIEIENSAIRYYDYCKLAYDSFTKNNIVD